jgi:hypothetical protein
MNDNISMDSTIRRVSGKVYLLYINNWLLEQYNYANIACTKMGVK